MMPLVVVVWAYRGWESDVSGDDALFIIKIFLDRWGSGSDIKLPSITSSVLHIHLFLCFFLPFFFLGINIVLRS